MIPSVRCPHVVLLVLTMLAAGVQAQADSQPAPTVVTVGEMCGGCVKTITKQFNGFKGVAEVTCDIPSKTVTFRPAGGQKLSPLVIWTEMDEICKTPLKLSGPSGTFTSKPTRESIVE